MSVRLMGRSGPFSLSRTQLREWSNAGFLLVERVFNMVEIKEALVELWEELPRPSLVWSSDTTRATLSNEFAAMHGFPFSGLILSNLATAPAIIHHSRQLLGSNKVQLYQAEAWVKYKGVATYEQTHHRDYAKNTMLTPLRGNSSPDFIGGLIFLSDVDKESGPTALVPRTSTQGFPLEPARYAHWERPDLYRNEVLATGTAGSVLYFSGDVFHRATELKREYQYRASIKFAVKTARATWVGYHRGLRVGFEPAWSHFAIQATREQWRFLGVKNQGRLTSAKRDRYSITSRSSKDI
jgi:hypothetical protein